MNNIRLGSSTDEIIAAVADKNGNYTSKGCECKFYDLGYIGAKLYRTKFERDQAFLNQATAARFGLGPVVGRRFNMPPRVGGVYFFRYGYTTDLADLAYTRLAQKGFDYEDEHEALCKQLRKIGQGDDLHDLNVGHILHNGEYKLAAIDFGPICFAGDSTKAIEKRKSSRKSLQAA